MIALIDYGAGNLRSVQKAFEHLGEPLEVTADPEVIGSAEAVILPGVGAFGDAMAAIRARGLEEAICSAAQSGRPFLGICLGLQLLFEQSEEAPGVRGLGILRGEVRRFPETLGLKIPHIGFNSLCPGPKGRLFQDLTDEPYFYFVHSYYCRVFNRAESAAQTEYGLTFDSAIERGNLFAVQFHPEKSGETGLRMLRRFVEIVHAQRGGVC